MTTEVFQKADDDFCKGLHYLRVAACIRALADQDPSVGALGRVAEKYRVKATGLMTPSPAVRRMVE